jgi:hypothetical protein
VTALQGAEAKAYAVRIVLASTAGDLHGVATVIADRDDLDPAERTELQAMFTDRCRQLWPTQCRGRNR